MAKLIHSTQSFMNAEDAIIAKKNKAAKLVEVGYVHHLKQGLHSKKAKAGGKRDRDSRKAGSSSGRYSNYTPLKWPQKMKGDPSKWNKSKCYNFHWDRGHDMNECYDLKQQIEVLIKQGKLKNFLGRDHKDERLPLKGKAEEPVCQPLGEIRVIMGGTSIGSSSKAKKTYFRVVQNVQLTNRPPRTSRANEPAITFTDEDAKTLHHPHDDAIVITLTIVNYTTRIVLINNGSSTYIFYYPAFQQMRFNKELLCPINVPFIGFGGMKILPVGTISLLVVVSSYPRQINKEVNFLVDCSSSYNAIIGRPTLNSWRATTFTYHLSIKFLTKYGIREVQGD